MGFARQRSAAPHAFENAANQQHERDHPGNGAADQQHPIGAYITSIVDHLRLRVLELGGREPTRVIDAALHAAGLQAEVREARPNLEDVFVSATRGREPAAAQGVARAAGSARTG